MAILLGVDPGSRFTGYGVLSIASGQPQMVTQGVISLPKTLDFPEKLRTLREELSQQILIHKPTHMVLERIFLGKNADSAFKLGHVRGVCMLIAAENGLGFDEYAARSVKKAVTGNGAATKEHVRLIVSRLLQISEEGLGLDASDALALALCHQLKSRENEQLRERGL